MGHEKNESYICIFNEIVLRTHRQIELKVLVKFTKQCSLERV